jgi:superfamily II DNA or RNA helicase
MELKPHQKHVIKHLQNHRGILAIHGTGTGKTIVATFSALTLLASKKVSKVIFISPVSLVANFKNTITKANAKYADKVEYYTIQGFMHSKHLCKNALLIIDEAHNLRTQNGVYFNRILECAKEASKVLLLSATPIINHPHDLINLIALINGEEPIPMSEFYEKMVSKSQSKKYLANVLHFYSRPLDDENFPNMLIEKKFFPMSPAYEKLYSKLEVGDNANVEEFSYSNDLVSFYNGVRRASNKIEIESPKIKFVVDTVKKSNGRCVVFSHFLEMGMNILQKHFDEQNITYERVSGNITKSKRDNAVKKYNSGEIKCLLISKAGGEGLDLKETKYIFVMEPTWNKSQLNQIIGRGVRYQSHKDSKSIVTVYLLYLVRDWEFNNIKKLQDKDVLIPPSNSKYRNLSIDLYLHNYVEAKEEKLHEFMEYIQTYKIDN